MWQFAVSSLISAFGTLGFLLLCAQSTFGEYSPKERTAIDQVRTKLGDILYLDYMKNDEYILPWLKARGMNVDGAIEMIKKSHKWRIQNQVDKLLDDKETSRCDTYYTSYDFVDRQGRPVLIINMGEWDVRKHVLAGKQQEFQRCCWRYMERMAAKLRKMHEDDPSTKNITQWTFIADLKGYNLRQHACIGCISSYITTVVNYESNYPQALHRMVLLNAPSFFDTLLNLAKPVMSPATRDALRVYGFNQGEWKAELRKEIDPDQLSTMWGGNLKHRPGSG